MSLGLKVSVIQKRIQTEFLAAIGRSTSAAIALLLASSAIAPAYAEGSRNLFPAGATGNRANIEWRTSFYGVEFVRRRTLLRVYARQGEAILLGSSAMGVQNGATSGDILVYNPGLIPLPDTVTGSGSRIGDEFPGITPPPPSFTCSGQRTTTGNATLGFIADRTQELAGPNTIINPATGAVGTIANAYPPCYYIAPATGLYSVIITGPSGLTTDTETAPTGSITDVQTGPEQDTSVAAWDITVRSNLADPNDLPGRLFSYYLTLFAGANQRNLFSTFFFQTRDGFLYRSNLKGIDPNGFIAFGSEVGYAYIDDRLRALNRDLVNETGGAGNADQLQNPQAGVRIANLDFPLFLNVPDPSALSELLAAGRLNRIAPVEPQVVAGSFGFAGTVTANTSTVGAGGRFFYQANVDHIYEIVVSRDGTDFDPTNPQNATLRGKGLAGNTSVQWNGLDNSGVAFPVGNNYQVRIVIRGGDYHFPLLDVENAPFGTPGITLLNPPGPNCFRFATGCTGAFYDDRGYQTPGGTVGTLNQPLPGAPTPASTDFGTGFDITGIGFDSTSSQRSFNNNFGDKKGLDLWTFYPSQARQTALNIIAGPVDLAVRKVVDNPATAVGQNAVFTVLVTNNGPSNATNVQLTDPLPAGLTFVSATPSQGTYDPVTGLWSIGSLNVNATATLQLTVTLTGTTVVRNIAQIPNPAQPDPDLNNNQGIASLNAPNLRLVKRITAITRGGTPIAFNQFVDDPTDLNDTAAGWAQSQLLPVGILNVNTDTPLSSGDEIEYTIYFLSDGVGPVLAANICDQIDPRTRFIDNTNQIQRGNALPTPGGSLLPPLSPLPAGNTCPNPSNPNGSAVFDLGNVPATPTGNVGFARFRVRIN